MPLDLKPPRIGKSPYWTVRGTYLGVYVERSTKAADRATAAKVLARWKNEIERGLVAKPNEPDFLNAAVAYMAATGNERYVDKVVDHFGTTPLRMIDQAAVDEAGHRLYPNTSAATRNRHVYTVVSAILKHAGIETTIKRPKGWRGTLRVDWLTPDQAFRMFAAADKRRGELGAFLRLLCYTGLRLNEGIGLTWDRVDLSEGFAYVPKTKNGKPRGVHLPPVVVAALANIEGREGRVFRFTKTGRLYIWLGEIKKAAGADCSFATFHTFRHTYATWMRKYGGLDTRGLVGTGTWDDPKSASRYEHVVATEEARKANLLPVEKPGNKSLSARPILKKKRAVKGLAEGR